MAITSMYTYGLTLFTMLLSTAMVSAHAEHHADRQSSRSHEQQQLWSPGSASSNCCWCNCSGIVAPQNITVYNYLAIQGPNSTTGYNTVQCGAPTLTQPNGYARTFCFDMPLLLEQDLSSKLLGVVQGTYVFISLAAPASTLFVTETFTLNTPSTPQGTFSASGLENIGQVTAKPITGGTDAFAFLTGIAITTPLTNGVDSSGNLVSWFKYVFTFRPASCN